MVGWGGEVSVWRGGNGGKRVGDKIILCFNICMPELRDTLLSMLFRTLEMSYSY